MEICIRNNWVSLKGSSEVKTLDGKDLYKVKGKFFSVTRKKFLQTLDGELIYSIRNMYWSFFNKKAYVLNPDGSVAALLNRKYFSVHDRYRINSGGTA